MNINKTTAAIGVVAVLAAAYVLIISPMEDKRAELQENLRKDYAVLYKYLKVHWNRKYVEPGLEQSRTSLVHLEQHIFQKSDISVAFARLQSDVQRMAAESGLSVTAVKPLPTVEHKHYVGLPIYVDCQGNIKQLGDFLKRLDEYGVFYGIDRLNINVSQDGSLKVKMQIQGLMAES